jgi:hypothetical protein
MAGSKKTMTRRRYEFRPLRVDCEVGNDGIAYLTFETEREDIVLELSSDVFLRLLDQAKHAQDEKVARVAKQSTARKKRK